MGSSNVKEWYDPTNEDHWKIKKLDNPPRLRGKIISTAIALSSSAIGFFSAATAVEIFRSFCGSDCTEEKHVLGQCSHFRDR
jgi:hypothetical protein